MSKQPYLLAMQTLQQFPEAHYAASTKKTNLAIFSLLKWVSDGQQMCILPPNRHTALCIGQADREELQQTYARLTPRYQQLAIERKDMQHQLSRLQQDFDKCQSELLCLQSQSISWCCLFTQITTWQWHMYVYMHSNGRGCGQLLPSKSSAMYG